MQCEQKAVAAANFVTESHNPNWFQCSENDRNLSTLLHCHNSIVIPEHNLCSSKLQLSKKQLLKASLHFSIKFKSSLISIFTVNELCADIDNVGPG